MPEKLRFIPAKAEKNGSFNRQSLKDDLHPARDDMLVENGIAT
jgi:hypothetical protein